MKHQKTNAIDTILEQKIVEFCDSYIKSSRNLFADNEGNLIHPGEFGTFREKLTKQLISNVLPERMGIDSGFVVSASGYISTQCDVIIYDKSATPFIKNEHGQRFFPVESVVAIGEVKSKLSLSELKNSLKKLSASKSMRDYLINPVYIHHMKSHEAEDEYKPNINEKDQVLTFLICEKFDFDIAKNHKNVFDCYSQHKYKIPFCHRHNMILSLGDGLLTYLYNDNTLYPFPSKLDIAYDYGETEELHSIRPEPRRLKHRLVIPQENSIEHIRHFMSLLHTALNVISVLFPEMAKYIADKEDVTFIDFEQQR